MQNNEARKLTEPISQVILNEQFEEVKVPFVNKRMYNADSVDRFLSRMSSEVANLEKASKRLLQFYENNKNGRVAESNSGPIEDSNVVDDVEMMQVLKSKEQRIERMQKHMAELFEGAEAKAEAIVADAELERVHIVDQAKVDADNMITNAQHKADEIIRTAEEKIQEAKLVKQELNQRAQEIQSEIILKADQLDDMKVNLSQMSLKLRGLVDEASA